MSETRTAKKRKRTYQLDLDRYKSGLEELRNFCGSNLLSVEGLSNFFELYHNFTCLNNDYIIAYNNIRAGYDFFLEACHNKNIDVGILRYLLKYFPGAAKDLDPDQNTPLHFACNNENVTLDIVKLLLHAAPGSAYHTTERFRALPHHVICGNSRIDKTVAVEIMKLLLEKYKAAVGMTDASGYTPFQYACRNKNVTPNIVELLLNAAPKSVLRKSIPERKTVFHYLCGNDGVDKVVAVEILKLLLEENSDVARMADASGCTPLDYACENNHLSFDFVQRLLMATQEATPGQSTLHCLCSNTDIDEKIALKILKKYPRVKLLESARQPDSDGLLPLHHACARRSKEFCSVLVEVYPDAINQATDNRYYPINFVIRGSFQRNEGRDALDVVKYLLDCDPGVKSQKIRGHSLLRWACKRRYDESNVEAGVQIINAIYDARPQAIYVFDSDELALNRIREEVRTFIERELVFARQASDFRSLMTPDENGRLPLHRALGNNATLGSIKLLVQWRPAALALDYTDNNGALPLHVACQHHNSPCVVHYLIDLKPASIQSMDNDGNTALHLACRGAKYETIAMILEKHDAVSLSKRNSDEKLPIDLLFESSEVDDRENAEYVGIVFRLLNAYPETLELGL